MSSAVGTVKSGSFPGEGLTSWGPCRGRGLRRPTAALSPFVDVELMTVTACYVHGTLSTEPAGCECLRITGKNGKRFCGFRFLPLIGFFQILLSWTLSLTVSTIFWGLRSC